MDLHSQITDPAFRISEIIRDILQDSREYVLKEGLTEKMGELRIGFSRGDDPLYHEFGNPKVVIILER